MTTNDLEAAVQFLRRVVPGKLDEDLLISTVTAIEAEIRRRRERDRNR